MIADIIRGSVRNRGLVLLAAALLAAWGIWALQNTPVDALPDLSDVQVIIRSTYPGQAPQIVENQVTYPLATTMLSVPGARTVRGISFFGDSFVYVLFEDGTDLYWARSRVLEYLNQAQSRLTATAKASLGPDATGVGWIFEYALVDRTGRHDLGQLRALQDWFLKYELKTLPNVAEVASLGGMVQQYQVVLDPAKLVAYNIPQDKVIEAIRRANNEAGGSVLELAESEYMVRASGYLQSLADFRAIPLGVDASGVAVRVGDVATVQLGPEMRRGVSELNGEGEVAGGVIVMRSGKNARATIQAVRTKLAELERSLPAGVRIVPTYDRSKLIGRAVDNLTQKLIEEFIVVAVVCVLFLAHLRSALVAIICLPLGVLAALIVMRYQGVSANIMSLGGVAIAIGAMVDAAVVMIENAHKHLEAWTHAHPDESLTGLTRWEVVTDAAVEVGPALFFSLIIITLSFIPVFTLEAQEGRLFRPLALTKTYAMAGAAGLAITLVPVLMGYWIRGRIPPERSNPLSRGLIALYRPVLDRVLRYPRLTLAVAAALFASVAWPLSQLGGEFMPPLNEGDVLYMPSALAGLPASKAAELLQLTDRMIKTVPEVATVFGKAGRAETVQAVVATAIGGETIGETVAGLARFPINVRYPRELRDSVQSLRNLPILTNTGGQITLGTVAQLVLRDGAPMLKTENARPSGWVYIDARGRDLASVVADLQATVAQRVHLKPGMSLTYSGQFEYLERANARLKLVVPATLVIIFVLLYLTFRRIDEAALIMATLPFALTGGIWFLYVKGYNVSVATAVGFIALAGVAAEFGVIMLLYLKQSIAARLDKVPQLTSDVLNEGIRDGAVLRVRPKAMTVAVIVAGLLPIFWGGGAGSEVMSRIAAPMVGGMLSAALLSMLVIPAAYRLLRLRTLRN